jgi:NAD(P)-dependent dehydrogenase (short-subunit alcohol dehydrogenase family)
MKIAGSVAVVTGGASGLGYATAARLAAAGAKVAILDRHKEAAETAASALKGLAIACNVSSEAELASAFNTIEKKWGTPRICVNCAGIAPAKRIVGREGPMPLTDFQQVIDVNLVGTFNVLRLAAYAMSKLDLVADSEERGVIINTASVAAYEGQIGQAAYSAAKGGVAAMTLPAARELAHFAIRVMTIAPGLMATPMLQNMPAEVQSALVAGAVFPQRLGKPEEFAELALHIIENSFLNGEVIRLDGAVRLREK